MTIEQLRLFFNDKNNSSCNLTDELIKEGYRQTKHGTPSNDYIAYYEKVFGYSPDFRKAQPSQWWHLIESYCNGKDPTYVCKQIRCGELLFWMAEMLLETEHFELNKEDLNTIKNEALKIAKANTIEPSSDRLLRTVEANKYLYKELFPKIRVAIEKHYDLYGTTI